MTEEKYKIMWMNEKWGYTYERALNQSTQPNRNIFFDDRYWKYDDIKEFFEDLEFVNHDVWELVHVKLSKVCHNRKAEKRFSKWLKDMEANKNICYAFDIIY